MAESLAHLPVVMVDSDRSRRISTGREVILAGAEAASLGGGWRVVRLLDEAGDLVAVGQFDPAAASVRPKVVLSAQG